MIAAKNRLKVFLFSSICAIMRVSLIEKRRIDVLDIGSAK